MLSFVSILIFRLNYHASFTRWCVTGSWLTCNYIIFFVSKQKYHKIRKEQEFIYSQRDLLSAFSTIGNVYGSWGHDLIWILHHVCSHVLFLAKDEISIQIQLGEKNKISMAFRKFKFA